jgi:hypothetical protein
MKPSVPSPELKKKAAEKFERMVECRKDGEQVLPVATVC